MYCAECGNKLKKTDKFCGECGALVEKEELVEEKSNKKSNTPSSNSEKKPMPKQTKIIIGVIVAVVVCFFTTYQILAKQYEPKKVAEDYLNAVMKKDTDRIYKYLNIEGDTTFVSKKTFNEGMKEALSSTNVEEFKVTKVEYEENKTIAKVSYSYKLKDSDSEKTSSINLEKSDSKNLFFFDDWNLENDVYDSLVVKDFKITVPKDAETTFEGIKLTKKYLDSKESTDSKDVYLLPQVFSKESTIKAKLSSGIELEKKVTPSSYRDYITISFSSDTISDKTKKEMQKEVKQDIETLYKAALEGKSFDDIKDTLVIEKDNLEDLTSDYNDFVSTLNSNSNKLKSIKFTDTSLSSLYDDDSELTIRIKAKYDYTVEYTNYNDETETKDTDSTGYFSIVYKYENGKYTMLEIRNLVTYFSRY